MSTKVAEFQWVSFQLKGKSKPDFKLEEHKYSLGVVNRKFKNNIDLSYIPAEKKDDPYIYEDFDRLFKLVKRNEDNTLLIKKQKYGKNIDRDIGRLWDKHHAFFGYEKGVRNRYSDSIFDWPSVFSAIALRTSTIFIRRGNKIILLVNALESYSDVPYMTWLIESRFNSEVNFFVVFPLKEKKVGVHTYFIERKWSKKKKVVGHGFGDTCVVGDDGVTRHLENEGMRFFNLLGYDCLQSQMMMMDTVTKETANNLGYDENSFQQFNTYHDFAKKVAKKKFTRKQKGMLKEYWVGIPDIFCWNDKEHFFVEIKGEKDSLIPSQKDFILRNGNLRKPFKIYILKIKKRIGSQAPHP